MRPAVTPFIGRNLEIQALNWTLAIDKIAVITGNQAVGKTELSIKFAELFKRNRRLDLVMLDCTSEETLLMNIIQLSKRYRFRLDGRSITENLKKVLSYFEVDASLFILDGAKPDNVLVKMLPNLIGKSPISIIITSRHKNWVDPKYHVVELEPFTNAESHSYIQEMLYKHLKRVEPNDSVGLLTDVSDHLPGHLKQIMLKIVEKNHAYYPMRYSINDYIAQKLDNIDGRYVAQAQATETEEIKYDRRLEQAIRNKLLEKSKKTQSKDNKKSRMPSYPI